MTRHREVELLSQSQLASAIQLISIPLPILIVLNGSAVGISVEYLRYSASSGTGGQRNFSQVKSDLVQLGRKGQVCELQWVSGVKGAQVRSKLASES